MSLAVWRSQHEKVRVFRMPVADTEQDNTDEVADGPFADGARIVRAALKEMSLRSAAEKMKGLGYPASHTTINNLKKGLAVESSSVINFAHAFKIDAEKLLKAFGHTSLLQPTSDLLQRTGRVNRNQEQPDDQSNELERIPDEDAVFFIETFEGASPQNRELLKAMAEKVREMDSRHSIGGRGSKD